MTDTNLEVGGTTSTSGTTTLNTVTYTWPSADGTADNYVLTTNSAGTLTWELDDTGTGVASDGLDFDEFVDAMTLDGNLIVSSGSGPFTTTWHGNFFMKDNASVSANFEVSGTASVSALTVGGASPYLVGGTDVSLADGGTGATLTDPNADKFFMWDDSANATVLAGLGGFLTFTATPT